MATMSQLKASATLKQTRVPAAATLWDVVSAMAPPGAAASTACAIIGDGGFEGLITESDVVKTAHKLATQGTPLTAFRVGGLLAGRRSFTQFQIAEREPTSAELRSMATRMGCQAEKIKHLVVTSKRDGYAGFLDAVGGVRALLNSKEQESVRAHLQQHGLGRD